MDLNQLILGEKVRIQHSPMPQHRIVSPETDENFEVNMDTSSDSGLTLISMDMDTWLVSSAGRGLEYTSLFNTYRLWKLLCGVGEMRGNRIVLYTPWRSGIKANHGDSLSKDWIESMPRISTPMGLILAASLQFDMQRTYRLFWSRLLSVNGIWESWYGIVGDALMDPWIT